MTAELPRRHWMSGLQGIERLDADLRTMAAALVGLVMVLFLLPVPLSFLPEPIGPAAALFGRGARATLLLTGTAGSIGLVLGTLAALGRLSHLYAARQLVRFYVWVIRGTPLVVQILFVYFAMPSIVPGMELSGFWSAVLALSLNVGAYNSEVIRAGILAVPVGQTEAAQSMGMRSVPIYMLVVLPQAARICLPGLVNNVVALLKDSSLAYVIGVVELTLVGSRIQAASFKPVPIFITVACIYLTLTTFLTTFSDALERRMARSQAR
jgi:polar amino acid transport system permease protein